MAEPADVVWREALEAAAVAAAYTGSEEILSAILADPRFAPSSGGACLTAALDREQWSAAGLLLAHPRLSVVPPRNLLQRARIAVASGAARPSDADALSGGNHVGDAAAAAPPFQLPPAVRLPPFRLPPAESCDLSVIAAEAAAAAFGGAPPSDRMRQQLGSVLDGSASAKSVCSILVQAVCAGAMPALGACLQHPLLCPASPVLAEEARKLSDDDHPSWLAAVSTACSAQNIPAASLLLAVYPVSGLPVREDEDDAEELQSLCNDAVTAGRMRIVEVLMSHPRTRRVVAPHIASACKPLCLPSCFCGRVAPHIASDWQLMLSSAAVKGQAEGLAVLLPILAGRPVPGALSVEQRLPECILGAGILDGFWKLRHGSLGDTRVAPMHRMLQVHAVVRAIASTPAPHPLYIRKLAGGALAAAAWARRHVVAARVRAFEED